MKATIPIIIDYNDTGGAVTWVKVPFYVHALDLFSRLSSPHLSGDLHPSAQNLHLKFPPNIGHLALVYPLI